MYIWVTILEGVLKEMFVMMRMVILIIIEWLRSILSKPDCTDWSMRIQKIVEWR